MKCCIQNCASNYSLKKYNTSRTASTNGVTFHLIPKDPKQRAAWLEALAKPNWIPASKAVICSDHFKEDDFYVTKKGMRRVKYGVVPVIKDMPVSSRCFPSTLLTKQLAQRARLHRIQDRKHNLTIDNINGPVADRVCKICLTLDAKMYKLKDYNLGKMYQDIMGIKPSSDEKNRLPMGICWECAARLQSATLFRSKALISNALLQDHLKTNSDLKIPDMLNLHRKHTTLKSSLNIQEVFKFNSQNLDEHVPNTLVKTEVIGIPHNEEIEIEVNELVNNKTTVKDEGKTDINDHTNLINDSVKTEIDLIPITELEREYEFDNEVNDNDDLVSEKVYLKNNDNSEITNIDFDYVIMVKNKEEIDVIDKNVDISDKMLSKGVNSDDSDDHSDDFDDGNTKVGNERVCVEEMKQPVVKKKKETNSTKVKKDGDNPRPKLVRTKRKQPYVKPSIPIDENIFTVTALNHERLIQEILERKESDRYKQAPFKCTVCYRGFPTKDKQARHVLLHSEQSGPLQCGICKVRMKLERDMRAHKKRQHSFEYTCKLCPLVTRNKSVALGHMKFHAGNKYQCPQCSNEFEKQTTLLNHLRLKHMSDCVCELCGYTFVSKNGVHAHKRMKHKFADKNAELKGPYCGVCEVKFLNQKAYDKHLRLSSKHMSEDDPNRLSNDPSVKSRRVGVTWLKPVRRPMIRRRDVNSVTVHNGPVICEQCGVELVNLRAYASHFKYSHPGINRTQFTSMKIPYMCEHCGKMFLNTTTLEGHMWVHTGQKRFQCDHCNKTFSMKSNLAGHMRQHEPVRRSYDCRVCGKLFAFNHNLTRHMFLHTGLRPFKCDACEKTFRTSGELRTHVDHVHLKKPRPKRVRRKAKKCDLSSLEY